MLPCPLQHLYLCAAWLGAPCLQEGSVHNHVRRGLSYNCISPQAARTRHKLDPIAVPGPEKVKTSEQEQR